MGGDGGTLNNSRHEHTRLRAAVLGESTKKALKRQRASVTHCAASKQPLQPPHVVVDRLGQLYNKDALISALLARARDADKNKERLHDAFAHIRSIKRDTSDVNLVAEQEKFVCPVTRKVVTAEANFSVGWTCGCVTAAVDGVKGFTADHNGERGDWKDEEVGVACIACSVKGERIRLGLTLEERDRLRDKLQAREQERRAIKKRKRKRALDAQLMPEKVPRISGSDVS